MAPVTRDLLMTSRSQMNAMSGLRRNSLDPILLSGGGSTIPLARKERLGRKGWGCRFPTKADGNYSEQRERPGIVPAFFVVSLAAAVFRHNGGLACRRDTGRRAFVHGSGRMRRRCCHARRNGF